MLTHFPKICIIIVNWNGKNDTLACLASIEKLVYPNFEVIVVDNGSTDGSVSAIHAQFPSYVLLETGINLGFAEGNNVGIQAALERGAELLFLLNNDTEIAPDILHHFVALFYACPEVGILGAKIYLFHRRDTLDHLGGRWDAKSGTFQFIGHRQKDEEQWQTPQEIDYVCGAGLIVKRSVIETIGYFEPRFFLIWEESDFCFRARRAGFKILTCPHAKLWHKVSTSFTGGKIHSTYFWWRNRLLWIERNCSWKEKFSLIFRVLLPETLHLLKIYLIKKNQFFLLKWFHSPEDLREKKLKLLKNRAALCGVRDYLLRRFGSGPLWIRNSDSI